jgi:outer membrane protein assembly factor BamB
MYKIHKLFILGVILLSSINVQAQPISQWRGSNRDGIYNENGLLKSWPENGPTLLWTYESLGSGFGSAVVASGKVFVNGETDGISQLFAFALDGKLLWKSSYGKEFMGNGFSAQFPGARSTPTISGNLVYTCSGNGTVACFDTESGKIKWMKNMVTDFKGIENEFGYAESLLIDGDKVYCSPGGPESNVMALNRFTGEPIWFSKGFGDTVSFTSPMMIHLSSRNILVTASSYYVFGLDANTGEMLWKLKQDNVQYKQQCNTPVYADGFLYYLAGDGNGAVKLQLSPDGSSVREVWRNSRVKNTIKGFVKFEDHIFAPDQNQKLKCIDVKDGQVTDSLKLKEGSLIFADGMFYSYSDNGMVNLVKLAGKKMEIVGKFKIVKGSKEHFSHPSISNGVLYIRHGNALMAYDIKQKA